jgi:hypothetical protein
MAWKFQNPLATLHSGTLTGQVDVTRPHLGLHQLHLESAALAGRICSVERDAPSNSAAAAWPAKLVEAYVRGDDLVATYQATDDWPFAPQVYWRADALPSIDQELSSLSLLVSVSTHLLDTHPRICAVTQLAADEVLHVMPSDDDHVRTTSLRGRGETVLYPDRGVCCLLWRLPGGQVSYAEIVPANDFRELTVRQEKDGMCQARWELIAEFLEKGVIRRTRLQSAFLPRACDVELAADCCRNFAARPLPLTT